MQLQYMMHAATKEQTCMSSIILLSENVQNYWSDTTMISVACVHIEQHLKCFVIFHNIWKHVFKAIGHFVFHFSNKKVPSSNKKKKYILEY